MHHLRCQRSAKNCACASSVVNTILQVRLKELNGILLRFVSAVNKLALHSPLLVVSLFAFHQKQWLCITRMLSFFKCRVNCNLQHVIISHRACVSCDRTILCYITCLRREPHVLVFFGKCTTELHGATLTKFDAKYTKFFVGTTVPHFSRA